MSTDRLHEAPDDTRPAPDRASDDVTYLRELATLITECLDRDETVADFLLVEDAARLRAIADRLTCGTVVTAGVAGPRKAANG